MEYFEFIFNEKEKPATDGSEKFVKTYLIISHPKKKQTKLPAKSLHDNHFSCLLQDNCENFSLSWDVNSEAFCLCTREVPTGNFHCDFYDILDPPYQIHLKRNSFPISPGLTVYTFYWTYFFNMGWTP